MKYLRICAALLLTATSALASGAVTNPLFSHGFKIGPATNAAQYTDDGANLLRNGSPFSGGGLDSNRIFNVVDGGAHLSTNGRVAGTGIINTGANGYVHAVIPHDLITYSSTSDYPLVGQLVRFTASDPDATYVSLLPLIRTNYTPHTTNNLPIPGTDTNFWRLLNQDGTTGSTGGQGIPGANGAGNINWSEWNSLAVYTTNTNTVVEYDDQWYIALQNSTNKQPDLEAAYWAVTISKGEDGTLLATNMVMRGTYNAGTPYTTNDAVHYAGSVFWKWTNAPSTNIVPIVSPPTHSAHWEVFLSGGSNGPTGPTGPQGPAGQDSVVSNITQYTIAFTNAVWLNNPDPVTNKFVYHHSTAGGTNYYAWTFLPFTNRFHINRTNADAGPVWVSNDYALATTWYRLDLLTNSGGGGSVSFTQAWSSIYTDGSTNAAYLSLGSSGTLFVAMGAAADPQFQTLAQLNLATGTPVYAEADTWQTVVARNNSISNTAAITNGALVLAGTSNSTQGFVQFPDGTKQYSAGVSGSTTVTNLPADLVSGTGVTTNAGPKFVIAGDGTGPFVGAGSTSIMPTGGANIVAGYATNSVIGGGSGNTISNATDAVIDGGSGNYIKGASDDSTIGGGNGNSINAATYGTIGGGIGNTITTSSGYPFIGGGSGNMIYDTGNGKVIVGGSGHSLGFNAAAAFGVIVGGSAHVMEDGGYSIIGGGANNTIKESGAYNVIGGGIRNMIDATGGRNVIAGGGGTSAAESSRISGSSLNSFIGSAYFSRITNAQHSAIVAGFLCNITNSPRAAIIGSGDENNIAASYGFIPTGSTNLVTGSHGIAMGHRAHAAHPFTFVYNSQINTAFASTASNQVLFNVQGGGVGINTNNPNGNALKVNGPVGLRNAGDGILTSGVCIVTLPIAQPDTSYHVSMSYATDTTLLTIPLGATNTTTTIHITGMGNNAFTWAIFDY